MLILSVVADKVDFKGTQRIYLKTYENKSNVNTVILLHLSFFLIPFIPSNPETKTTGFFRLCKNHPTRTMNHLNLKLL